MEPKYYTFRSWLFIPIILWQYDWFPLYVVSKICLFDRIIGWTNPSYGNWLGNPIALFYVQLSIFAPVVLVNVNLTKINQMAWNHQLQIPDTPGTIFFVGKLFAPWTFQGGVFCWRSRKPEAMTWSSQKLAVPGCLCYFFWRLQLSSKWVFPKIVVPPNHPF